MDGSHVRSSLLALALCLATPIALGAQKLPRAMPRARLVPLPLREGFQVWGGETGDVRVVGRDATFQGVLVRLDESGTPQVIQLGGAASGISSDGTAVAGNAQTPNALYFEGAWWEADDPVTLHTLGGQIRTFAAVENTSSGLVLVGSDGFGGQPFDARPGGGPGGTLPGIPGVSSNGLVTGLSLDGSTYCGQIGGLGSHAVRWVNRQTFALDESGATSSAAYGITPDGASFAGAASIAGVWRPVVWLSSEGLALRALVDSDGAPFSGEAKGILADGVVFGSGTRDAQGFGWVWHPSSATGAVTRFEDWFAFSSGRPPSVQVTELRDVHACRSWYHCILQAGAQALYAKVPRM